MKLKAVLIAGGRGTRLHPVTGDAIPKALVEVAGEPIIAHQLRLLKQAGVNEVVVLAGHLADRLEQAVHPIARSFDMSAHVIVETTPLGTGGALRNARDVLNGETFLAMCGDIAVHMDLERFVQFHKHRGATVSVVTHPNDHPHTSDLLHVDDEGWIRAVLPRNTRAPGRYRNVVIASVYCLSPAIYSYIEADTKQDLNNDIIPRLIQAGERVASYDTPEYLKDVGTPERLGIVERDFARGLPGHLHISNRRGAVFFDRDGVLNEHCGGPGVLCPDDLTLIPGAGEAVRRVNEAGLLAVLVTNQPQVAKGFLTVDELNAITAKLETELGYHGAKLDRIYYCPHYPKAGFEGEVPSLKISCACRKPAPGMLLRASEELPVDLASSCLIGDSHRDLGAARAAGVEFYGVRTGDGCRDCEDDVSMNRLFDTVAEAVEHHLERTKDAGLLI